MSASFFSITNPTPAAVPSLYAASTAATAAATSAATAANNQLAAYTVVNNTWAPNVTINWDLANLQRITLGGPTTFTFVGGVDGEKLVLEITQDSIGGRTITLPANVRTSSTLPFGGLSTTGTYMDKLGFMLNSAAGKYDFVAATYGFH